MEPVIQYALLGVFFLWAIIITVLHFRQRARHEHDMDKLADEKEQGKQKAIEKSKNTQRSVLKGKIGEHMAPIFPEFYEKYEPSDAKFLGDPIDYVIFKNMSKFDKNNEDNEPIEVVLVDVKTGKSNLSDKQKAIRDAVEQNRVSFDVVRLNDNNSKRKESTPKVNLQKTESQKKYPSAYEPWTESDDDFLENYWNDKLNIKSRNEKIQKISEKLGRNKGAITSRLAKIGLE